MKFVDSLVLAAGFAVGVESAIIDVEGGLHTGSHDQQPLVLQEHAEDAIELQVQRFHISSDADGEALLRLAKARLSSLPATKS